VPITSIDEATCNCWTDTTKEDITKQQSN